MSTAAPLRVRLVAEWEPLSMHELTIGEKAQAAALPSDARRRSWLVARRALRRALADSRLPTDTSTYGFPHRRASLSYDRSYVVAAVADDAEVLIGVGVDVQTGRAPEPETARLFLAEHEREALESTPALRQRGELLRMWTVKEALYKADPDNAATLDLRRYHLDDPRARCGEARTATAARFHYRTLALCQGFLTVALTLSQNGAPTGG